MTKTARADIIGSLLRPEALKQVRQSVRERKAGAAELRAAEDAAVTDAIAMQERAGLDVVSDGELRRTIWVSTGATGLDEMMLGSPVSGFSRQMVQPEENIMSLWRNRDPAASSAIRTPAPFSFVTEKIRPVMDVAEIEYKFLRDHASSRTKYTITAPSWHRVHWNPRFSSDAYARVDDFLAAMRDYLRSVVDEVIAMGCDYVQLDAPNYAMFYADANARRFIEAQGRDAEAELAADSEFDNSVFDGLRGRGVTCALHVCRGNPGGGGYMGVGGYDSIAPVMFPRLTNIDTLLLEYDTPRAGDFTPLQHVRNDATVVLGLMTTKEPALESAESLKQRIYEAERYVSLDRLALSPQCGFASTEGGNPLTPAEQEAKLVRLVEVARAVWSN